MNDHELCCYSAPAVIGAYTAYAQSLRAEGYCPQLPWHLLSAPHQRAWHAALGMIAPSKDVQRCGVEDGENAQATAGAKVQGSP